MGTGVPNLKGGQGWTVQAQLGQLKTRQGGKRMLESHLWCPNDLARLWDRTEFASLKHEPQLLWGLLLEKIFYL